MYSKDKLNSIAGKIKGCADELIFLAERAQFESGEGGATDRALRAAREMQDELVRIAELRTELITEVKAGIEHAAV